MPTRPSLNRPLCCFTGVQRFSIGGIPGVGAEERGLRERPCGQVHDGVRPPADAVAGCCGDSPVE